ncbi:MAG: CAP domain-containing protein [Sandaracinaceae bacterium]
MPYPRSAALLALPLLLSACDDGSPTVDAGPDARIERDAGDIDAGDPGMCVGVSCMLDAHCVPETGVCECDVGFSFFGDVCLPLEPDDPALRTAAEVCMGWSAGHVEDDADPWTPGTDSCDPGTLSMTGIDDTLRRVNMFRWLAGLPEVGYDGSHHSELMECAHMMSMNRSLSHMPPTSWTCWATGGADAAGRSNIALGYRSPGTAIDGYMTDVGTESLGHRRWILGTRLGEVEIGYSEGGALPGQCLGVFDASGSSDRSWTAYPNPGFAPLGMLTDSRDVVTWSFQANDFDLPASTSVEVTHLASGRVRPVTSYLTGGGGPPPSIAFTPTGWTPRAGDTYRVHIIGTELGDVIYDTTIVDCP